MTKYCITVAMFVACCGLPFANGHAQGTMGRWSIGVHGGANLWVNDMNERKVGEGGDLYIRYGITPYFSLGLQGGYEELKGFQNPTFRVELPNEYLKLRATNLSLVGWVHMAPGQTIAPYVYFGAGMMVYKRATGFDVHFPANKYYSSMHIPIGFGFEGFFSPRNSITIEAGGRILDDNTENFKFKAFDWYGTVRAGVNFYLGSSETDDEDGDGLTGSQEEEIGTDVTNPDSDGDGLRDGEEVLRYKTDPTKPDSDGDGLSDGDEVFKYRTDPSQSDTDGDGLSDGIEIIMRGTDPLKIDTDGDALTDGDEITKYRTDPLKDDTDGDGLTDWDEIRVYRSDPSNPDTDGDGLLDGEEVKKHKTDPTKSDTDAGGISDGAEVLRNANPLNPSDDTAIRVAPQMLMEGGTLVSLQGVNFASGSTSLLNNAEKTLQRAYNALSKDPSIRVEVAGYTDNVGDAESNRQISLKRAQGVKDWLVRKGIAASRLSVVGHGMSDPVETNATLEGRANNRRVEFHIIK